jgi:hypothetical protein
MAVRVLAFNLTLAACAIVPTALLRRQLNVRRFSTNNALAAVITAAAAIIAAVAGAGIWALAVRQMAYMALVATFGWIAVRPTPMAICCSSRASVNGYAATSASRPGYRAHRGSRRHGGAFKSSPLASPARAGQPPAEDQRRGRHRPPLPLIVKPMPRRWELWDPTGAGGKAVRANSFVELTAALNRLPADECDVLAQELVAGPETRVESYHAYIDDHGETVAEFTGRKIRRWPAEYGHSTALEVTDAADVAAVGRDVLERIGLRGRVAKVDFRRDRHGCIWLLEVNPRFTLWSHVAARAGVNLLAPVYRDLIGEPRGASAGPGPVPGGSSASRPARSSRSGIPVLRWGVWAAACEAKSGVFLDDPLPFIFGCAQAIRQAANRIRSG